MTTELITVRTADGVELDGAMCTAAEPIRPRTEILIVHGLTWNFYRGPSRWLPPLLATAGYSSLALNMRDHDSREPKDFDMAHHDLRAGVDYLFEHGAHTVVMLGHGYGCNKIVRYPALSTDLRVQHWILTTLGAVKRHRPDFWYDGLRLASQITGAALVVQGAMDPAVEGRSRADEFQAATLKAHVEVVFVEGADHYFTDRHHALAESVIGWLGRTVQRQP